MMDKVRVGDLEMCYRVIGEGHPLVMIMGLTANMDWWDPELLETLSDRYRLLIFDNRGAGRTVTPEEGEITVPQMADDTVALMNTVGFDSAYVLGVSMGGMIAQELALNHPAMVEKLILCCTNCGPGKSVYPPEEVIAKLVDRSGSPEEQVRRVSTLLFPREWLDEHEEYIDDFMERHMRAPATDANAARQFMATVGFNTYERLAGIGIPTLVTCGMQDVLIPPVNSEIISDRIPGSRLITFDGAGHGFINQCRERFVRELEGFLDS